VKDLSLLPAEEFGLDYIDQFVNQIGEFARISTQQITKGDRLNNEQEKTLASMHERLIEVNRKVQELAVNLQTQNISWLDKASPSWETPKTATPAVAQGDEGSTDNPSSIRSGLEQLDSSLQKLPPFSYSGQIDTHAVSAPLGLSDQTVTAEEAKTTALNFLKTIGYPNPDPKPAGTSNGVFAGYIFTYENINVDVSKQGGVVTYFRDDRSLGLQQLTTEQTAFKAMQTLKDLGWNTFVATAAEDFGGYIQLDAVNVQKGVRIYPDKIRLTVGKDNGQISGYDSTSYWLYNHGRTLKPELTLDQATKILRSDLAVKEKRLAVISLPGYQEAFCYEFRGKKDDEEFLIYINAVNGTEEKIQRIVITPKGEFLQ